MRHLAKCGHCNNPLVPTHSKKKQVKYYYYICNSKNKTSEAENEYPIKRLLFQLLENLVREQMKKIFVSEDILKLLARKS